MTTIKLNIIFHICRAEKILPFPITSILERKHKITPIFIDEGLLCNHQFQFLISKDLKIQRSQNIDQDEIN